MLVERAEASVPGCQKGGRDQEPPPAAAGTPTSVGLMVQTSAPSPLLQICVGIPFKIPWSYGPALFCYLKVADDILQQLQLAIDNKQRSDCHSRPLN